jgi:aryl-alcohol dehydrogenase-like predicted oxidoreductase
MRVLGKSGIEVSAIGFGPQGALGWLLARSRRTVPIPGIRTVAQAEQNATALDLGPLTPAQMAEIARLLGD